MPSTVIQSFQYDPSTRKLLIVFQTGKHYTYQNVPEEIYRALKNSSSKGEYFNMHIREQFSFVREPRAG